MEWYWKTLHVLYYAFLPIIIVLQYIFAFLIILLSPFLLFGQYIWHGLFVLPFNFLSRFEACDSPFSSYAGNCQLTGRQSLYIFISVALLTGGFAGCCIYFALDLLSNVMDMQSDPEPEAKGHTAASYRAARRRRQEQKRPPSGISSFEAKGRPIVPDGTLLEKQYSAWLDQDRKKRNDGVLASTIVEEDDSDY